MTTYVFTVNGTAADNQTWEVTGNVDLPPGNFRLVFNEAMKQTFQNLIHGKAVYGFPGVGCRGPYAITKVLIEMAAASLPGTAPAVMTNQSVREILGRS